MSVLKPAEKIGRRFQNPVATRVGGPGLALKILPLYLSNKEERVPRQRLGPFKTDASVYAQAPSSGLRITWMGHSSLLVEIDGLRVLVDPVWDERASPVSWAGPKRFFEPPLPLDELPVLDAVLISHDHYDHLGKQTIQRLSGSSAASRARWITSLGVGGELRRFGVPPQKIVELNWTEATEVGAMRMTALPARHFSGRGISGRYRTLWSSFALKGPAHNLYYGADSGLWPGFADIGQDYGPFDLAMLEVGAYHELWKQIHLGPEGVAQAFGEIGTARLLMPIHWGLFDLALHAWYEPIEKITELAGLAGIPLWSPEPGVPTDVVAGQECHSDWWKRFAAVV